MNVFFEKLYRFLVKDFLLLTDQLFFFQKYVIWFYKKNVVCMSEWVGWYHLETRN